MKTTYSISVQLSFICPLYESDIKTYCKERRTWTFPPEKELYLSALYFMESLHGYCAILDIIGSELDRSTLPFLLSST